MRLRTEAHGRAGPPGSALTSSDTLWAVGHGDPGLRSIVFDCREAWAQASWWAQTIPGYHLHEYDEEDLAELKERGIERLEDNPSVVIRPDGDGPSIWFNAVPEPKVGKARVHIDVNVAGVQEIDRLVERGATVLRPLGAVPDEPWVIMADPEGTEFCAFPPADSS